MLRELAYALVPITDLARSVIFYRDVLGLPLVWLEQQQGHAAVETSGLLLVLSTHEPPGAGGTVLAFDTQDMDTVLSALEERGVRFPQGIQEHGGRRTARFADPDGNSLELNQTRHPPPT